jgi:hypothetical protein
MKKFFRKFVFGLIGAVMVASIVLPLLAPAV